MFEREVVERVVVVRRKALVNMGQVDHLVWFQQR